MEYREELKLTLGFLAGGAKLKLHREDYNYLAGVLLQAEGAVDLITALFRGQPDEHSVAAHTWLNNWYDLNPPPPEVSPDIPREDDDIETRLLRRTYAAIANTPLGFEIGEHLKAMDKPRGENAFMREIVQHDVPPYQAEHETALSLLEKLLSITETAVKDFGTREEREGWEKISAQAADTRSGQQQTNKSGCHICGGPDH